MFNRLFNGLPLTLFCTFTLSISAVAFAVVTVAPVGLAETPQNGLYETRPAPLADVPVELCDLNGLKSGGAGSEFTYLLAHAGSLRSGGVFRLGPATLATCEDFGITAIEYARARWLYVAVYDLDNPGTVTRNYRFEPSGVPAALDINGDRKINAHELSQLRAQWLWRCNTRTTDGSRQRYISAVDFNADGVVNFLDVVRLRPYYLTEF